MVGLEYLQLLLDKVLGGWIPVGYLIFSMVGTVGLIANLLLVYLFLHFSPLSFDLSQGLAGFLVIALNFILNNTLTFRSARLRGARAIQGLALFYIACSVGLSFNLIAAHGFRDFGVPRLLAALVGIVIGSVWNYWVTSLFIWGIRRHRAGLFQTAYSPELVPDASTVRGVES